MIESTGFFLLDAAVGAMVVIAIEIVALVIFMLKENP
jgi:hypothetical protein